MRTLFFKSLLRQRRKIWYRSRIRLLLRFCIPIFTDIFDQPLHLLDLFALGGDDLIRSFLHAWIFDLCPLAGEDRDRVVWDHALHVINTCDGHLAPHKEDT